MPWKSVIREFVPPIVMKALRPAPSIDAGGYISAPATIAAAQAAGLSVCDYVERLWGIEGNTARIIERLQNLGAISSATKTVIEIGPGTGRYIDHILKQVHPERYQIYEINDAWTSWLAKTYPIEPCSADGKSLGSTRSDFADLIHAHGVFVYLPFLISFRYFREIARVAAPGAFVVFDILSETCFDDETTDKWLTSGHNFPCFLSSAYVKRLFEINGFRFIESFLSPYDVGWSEYLVFCRAA